MFDLDDQIELAKKFGTVVALESPAVQRGCVVITSDKNRVVYAGPIGKAATPHIKVGAVLHLHAEDLADGNVFARKHMQ